MYGRFFHAIKLAIIRMRLENQTNLFVFLTCISTLSLMPVYPPCAKLVSVYVLNLFQYCFMSRRHLPQRRFTLSKVEGKGRSADDVTLS
jgi:hypothetical protein